ncbi:hypothetical protein ACLOJK_034535 [Asimina triloba]
MEKVKEPPPRPTEEQEAVPGPVPVGIAIERVPPPGPLKKPRTPQSTPVHRSPPELEKPLGAPFRRAPPPPYDSDSPGHHRPH